MDKYITGAAIRRLRESRNMTQEELAGKIYVSSKTVSKWETGQGLPDISLLEPLAGALGISVIELFSGDEIRNRNRSANIARTRFYVCPVCGNVVRSCGEAVISCCGIRLPPLEAEEGEGEHEIRLQVVEDEYYVSLKHPMTREHHISFLAAVSDHAVQFVKLYPEGEAEARFRIDRVSAIYAYCKRHGLFELKLRGSGKSKVNSES